jgi:hypothetical protein
MPDLTKEQIQEKIARVKSDIAKHNQSAEPRMLQGLHDYIEYLEYELKQLDKK